MCLVTLHYMWNIVMFISAIWPKKDEYKVCSLLDKANPKFCVQAAEDSQFCQTLRYQTGCKGLVWHYINIDAMTQLKAQDH